MGIVTDCTIFYFSISALPPLGQKSYVQTFERRSGCKIIKQNMPVIQSYCIASLVKLIFQETTNYMLARDKKHSRNV